MISVSKIIIVVIAIALILIFTALWFQHDYSKRTPIQVSNGENVPSQTSVSEITLVFTGDVMLGRLVGHRYQANHFATLFEHFDTEIFEEADIAWANLEGPISPDTVQQDLTPDNLNFLFSKESLSALQNLYINLVGLANNHTFDRGKEGFLLTHNLLEEAGIDWHGSPVQVDEQSVYRFQKGGIVVSFIAVHTLYEGSVFGVEKFIQQEKESGSFVIVLPHWGEEYQTTHSANQENYAKSWARAGADIIIGTHPHVVQDAELIERNDGTRTLVFYSLGNFVFDQIFSEETQLGLVLKVVIDSEKSISVELIPMESINLKPTYATGIKREKVIDKVCRNFLNCSADTEVTTISL